MERWLQAATRYRKVAESGIESKKWAGPEYSSLREFAGSKDFSAALELLSASDTELVLANEPFRSKRRRRSIGLPYAVKQRVFLGKDGFSLDYEVFGAMCYPSYQGPFCGIKPPRLLSAFRTLVICNAFGCPENRILSIITNGLDELTAWAP